MEISGPFGRYESGSSGAVLNSLVRKFNIPLRIVEDLILTGNSLFLYGKFYGNYIWKEDGTLHFTKAGQ